MCVVCVMYSLQSGYVRVCTIYILYEWVECGDFTFDEDCAREGIVHFLYESEFLFAKHVLVDEPGFAENLRGKVIHWIHLDAATGQSQTLHVPSLGPAKSQNSLLGKHIESQRVDASLIDDNKALVFVDHL